MIVKPYIVLHLMEYPVKLQCNRVFKGIFEGIIS
jgi:hypothetical protein